MAKRRMPSRQYAPATSSSNHSKIGLLLIHGLIALSFFSSLPLRYTPCEESAGGTNALGESSSNRSNGRGFPDKCSLSDPSDGRLRRPSLARCCSCRCPPLVFLPLTGCLGEALRLSMSLESFAPQTVLSVPQLTGWDLFETAHRDLQPDQWRKDAVEGKREAGRI